MIRASLIDDSWVVLHMAGENRATYAACMENVEARKCA
jgi:hypothetical protein